MSKPDDYRGNSLTGNGMMTRALRARKTLVNQKNDYAPSSSHDLYRPTPSPPIGAKAPDKRF